MSLHHWIGFFKTSKLNWVFSSSFFMWDLIVWLAHQPYHDACRTLYLQPPHCHCSCRVLFQQSSTWLMLPGRQGVASPVGGIVGLLADWKLLTKHPCCRWRPQTIRCESCHWQWHSCCCGGRLKSSFAWTATSWTSLMGEMERNMKTATSNQ